MSQWDDVNLVHDWYWDFRYYRGLVVLVEGWRVFASCPELEDAP